MYERLKNRQGEAFISHNKELRKKCIIWFTKYPKKYGCLRLYFYLYQYHKYPTFLNSRIFNNFFFGQWSPESPQIKVPFSAANNEPCADDGMGGPLWAPPEPFPWDFLHLRHTLGTQDWGLHQRVVLHLHSELIVVFNNIAIINISCHRQLYAW